MNDETAQMTPAERMTKGLCPECGRDMKGINALAERDHHWDMEPEDRPASREALKRWKMLTNYSQDQIAIDEATRVDARRAGLR